jgi:hypothetical protein
VKGPSLVVGLAAALLVPRVASAQAVSSAHRLEIAIGIISSSVLDAAASPLRYGGAVPALDLGYGIQGAASRLSLRVGTAWGVLTSDITRGDLPREEARTAWVEIEYLRLLGDGSRRTRWLLGGRLAARAAVRDHYSADPARGETTYGFGAAECAPVVALERRLPSGTLQVRAGVSLLALVARPYTDLRALTRVPLRAAALWQFQAASLAIAYVRPFGTRTALVWTYRLQIERLGDRLPFRSAAQTGSLGLSIRLAGRT